MKILSYSYKGSKGLGCLWDDQTVADFGLVYSKYRHYKKQEPSMLPEFFPSDLLSLIQEWDMLWPEIDASIKWLREIDNPEISGQVFLPVKNVQVLAPISNPTKVVCVGLNYRDHCREHNFSIPDHPVLFSKFPSSIIGPYDPINFSRTNSQKVDYEAELAVVIKKVCRNVSPEEAPDYIAGYSVLNDISARDVQFSDGQWIRGKSFDTFCPFGPYLTTCDEVVDPQQLGIRCVLNGEEVQSSNTAEMIFSCNQIISFISQVATLFPGDLIATGTPAGVGSARDPQIFLKDSDLISVEIDGLGEIRNPIRELQ
jgi:2-keto-4-pentenoate hydratase/2-oxohepta-3-ene-1,7-dioic acid hydratase in catechol pathway